MRSLNSAESPEACCVIRRMSMKLLFMFCLLVPAAWAEDKDLTQRAPAKFAAKPNPMEGSERARQAGAKLFARECAACHGEDAGGSGKAPALKRPDVSAAPPGVLFWILENGALHQGMPSFAHLPDAQRWQIITYLRSFGARQD